MTKPLVWLPFDVNSLGEVPQGLRFAKVRPEPGGAIPPGADEVEFYVPPYGMAKVDGELFGHLRRLKVVHTLTAGVDHIRPVIPDGVTLCNGRGIHDTATAEMTLTLMLSYLRGVPAAVQGQAAQIWHRQTQPGLADKTVLIVGYGQIGAAIEARLRPFEVEVLRVARTAREGVAGTEALPQLIPQADIVVLIVPGTRETTGMVDADFLARMRDGALLVNMARGTVVNQDALLAELHSGRLHAAVDVTDPEPLPPDHPLWQAPNLLITPHVGGATDAMWPRVYRLIRAQLQRFAAGEPLHNIMTGAY